MTPIRVLWIAGAIALTLTFAVVGSADHGRFPGFVYTSPEAIKDAQDVLVALKYLPREGYTEGVWDTNTREATQAFQREHFLRPDGRLDRDTMAVLMSHRPRTNPPGGAESR